MSVFLIVESLCAMTNGAGGIIIKEVIKMTFKTIIEITEGSTGNHIRGKGDIYISPTNMETFVDLLEKCNGVLRMSIIPYLINTEDMALYELLYYCFDVEMLDIPRSYFIEFPKGNVLAEEIVNNIKPKIVVAKNDKSFLIKTLKDYLKSMNKMAFEEDRNSDKSLEKAELFYQIY